jgi:phage-related minor tail protein
MPEENLPQDGEQTPEPTPADTGSGSPDDVKAELERTRKALKEANREAAERRKKLEAFEAKEKERQAAEMTELEKAQAEAAEAQKRAEDAEQARATAEAKAQERLLRADVLIEASKQGFNDPADAWLHLDKSLVEGKEDGSFKGIEKAVKAVLETKPYLGKKADKAIGTPRTQPNGNRPAPQDQPAPLGLKLRL